MCVGIDINRIETCRWNLNINLQEQQLCDLKPIKWGSRLWVSLHVILHNFSKSELDCHKFHLLYKFVTCNLCGWSYKSCADEPLFEYSVLRFCSGLKYITLPHRLFLQSFSLHLDFNIHSLTQLIWIIDLQADFFILKETLQQSHFTMLFKIEWSCKALSGSETERRRETDRDRDRV